jgi:hypothetical protein
VVADYIEKQQQSKENVSFMTLAASYTTSVSQLVRQSSLSCAFLFGITAGQLWPREQAKIAENLWVVSFGFTNVLITQQHRKASVIYARARQHKTRGNNFVLCGYVVFMNFS